MKKFTMLAAVPAALGASMGSALAALPADVTTAIDAAETDLLALYAALTVVGATIWVARLIYRHFRPR